VRHHRPTKNKRPKLPPGMGQPFSHAEFERRLALDTALRQIIIAVIVAAVGAVFVLPLIGLPHTDLISSVLAPLVLLAVWLGVSTTTAKVARALPEIGANIADQPAMAERMIHEQLARKPVMRWARLLTYHRLATLRHSQRRFEETADICQHVLGQPIAGPTAGPIRAARANLLLMLAEAHLATDNLPGAYRALDQLHRTQLSLTDAIQRLALQTRYALKIGAWEHALEHGRAKTQLAELMPPPQCGAMHAMLATAAQKQGRDDLASWLWERAELITPPPLMQQLREGAFDVEVITAAGNEDATGDPIA